VSFAHSITTLKPHPLHWHATQGAGLLMALGIGLGLLFAAQLQSQPARAVQPDESSRQTAAGTIQRLEAEQSELKKQIAQLRAEVVSRQQQFAADRTTLSGLQEELERQQVVAGVTDVKGPAVRVLLDDSSSRVAIEDDPAYYIVHEYHLRDVVNLLWKSGAEAIAINGERLVGTSSIYCVGSTIMINDTRMSPPFEITAIGNPNALEDALNNSLSLRALKARVKTYGVQFKTTKLKEAILPAYNGSLEIKVSGRELVN
jgi:uncharacterized protein YlxW (UPF0749 family)